MQSFNGRDVFVVQFLTIRSCKEPACHQAIRPLFTRNAVKDQLRLEFLGVCNFTKSLNGFEYDARPIHTVTQPFRRPLRPLIQFRWLEVFTATISLNDGFQHV